MQLTLKDDLPFTKVKVAYREQEVEIDDVLVDTGSATMIFSADLLAEIDITPLPEDILYTIRGVGGIETVFSRVVDYVQLGKQKLSQPEIEVGGMDYSFEINGILGMDFLTKVGAVINLRALNISFD